MDCERSTNIITSESQEILVRIPLSEILCLRRLGSLSILVRTPDEAQLPTIVSLPCEHFSVAQDALSGPRLPGGTFSFDHLVDRAADARSSEVGHGRKYAPIRHAQLAARMPVTPPISLSSASGRGLFPFSVRLCHAFKKDWRALYRPQTTGTIDLPSPWLRRVPSQLHDDRIVGWVKFFAHALLNGDGRLKFQRSPSLMTYGA